MKLKIIFALVGLLWGITAAVAVVNGYWVLAGIGLVVALSCIATSAKLPYQRHYFRDGSVVADILRWEDLR